MAKAAKVGAGKRVGGFVYVHRDALSAAAELVREAVLKSVPPDGFEWNVAKVSDSKATAGKLSLLLYEDFDRFAFPALLNSPLTKFGAPDSV